ncbi:non-heme iron oxygenase ferredoxin subunit [Anaerolineales bacterium HSG6]|nr:non-heme iron oxygenase ferredoxin subunit [Anaerolineales bacterium HSG6]MDM8532503.1 non-heme iron oxygenase ferredoxin subunit [Anaerolineales bacterium HSG25]
MEFIKVATLSEIPIGERILVAYEEDDVGIFNLAGKLYAILDICTHDNGPLLNGKLDGDCVICPRHGARFNLKTGQQTMPAFSPAPRYHVKIEGDDVLIAPLRLHEK